MEDSPIVDSNNIVFCHHQMINAWSLSCCLGFMVDGGGWKDSCGVLIVPKSNIGKH